MHKFQKIFLTFIFVFTVIHSNAFADTADACANICDPDYVKAAAQIQQEAIAQRKELAAKAMTPPEGNMEDFSCINDIWSDIKGYFSGGVGDFDLGALWDAAADMACQAATDLAAGAADAIQSGVEAAVSGAGYAVSGAFTGALNEYTGGITNGLDNFEDLTDINGGITGFVSDYAEDQLNQVDRDYNGVLYVNTRDVEDSIGDKIGG